MQEVHLHAGRCTQGALEARIPMAKRDTRKEIAEAFVRSVEENSLSAVRVADLIAPLGINRNTFYYHFTSKHDLALDVLKHDLDGELRANLPEKNLVYEKTADTATAKRRYALFTHIETGARTLDGSAFLLAFLTVIKQRPRFYRKLLDHAEHDFLMSLKNLYMRFYEDDVRFVLGGRYMPEEFCRMLARNCVDMLVSTVKFYSDTSSELMLSEKTNPFLNIINETLYLAIQNHPVARRGA